MRQQMEEEQWDLCRLLDAALHGSVLSIPNNAGALICLRR